MMTWAANKYGGVVDDRAVPGVYHGHRQIAAALDSRITKWTSCVPGSTTRRGTSASSTRAGT
jgi:hypothetical protein